MRLRICLLATALALAACGGSEGATSSTAGPDAPEVSTTVAPGSDAEEPAETTAPEGDSDSGDSDGGDVREVDVSEATIVLGDETYLFKGVAGGVDSCNPNRAGGEAFYVSLARVDESGSQMEADPSDEEFINGLFIVLLLEDPDGSESEIALVATGLSWVASAGVDGRSSIDSVSVEGNHAHGTATFVRFEAADEGPVSGTFEVICAN